MNVPKFEDTLPLDEVDVPKFEDTMSVEEQEANQTSSNLENLPSVVESSARGLAQSSLLGFADEISGAIKNPLGAAKAAVNLALKEEGQFTDEDTQEYYNQRDKWRERDAVASTVNPLAFAAGTVAGAFVIPGAGISAVGSKVSKPLQKLYNRLSPEIAKSFPKVALGNVKGSALLDAQLAGVAVKGSFATKAVGTQAGIGATFSVGSSSEDSIGGLTGDAVTGALVSGAIPLANRKLIANKEKIDSLITKGIGTLDKYGKKVSDVNPLVRFVGGTLLTGNPISGLLTTAGTGSKIIETVNKNIGKVLTAANKGADIREYVTLPLANSILNMKDLGVGAVRADGMLSKMQGDDLSKFENNALKKEQEAYQVMSEYVRKGVSKDNDDAAATSLAVYGQDHLVRAIEAPETLDNVVINEKILGNPDLVAEGLVASGDLSRLLNDDIDADFVLSPNKIVAIEDRLGKFSKKLNKDNESQITDVRSTYNKMLDKVSTIMTNPEIMTEYNSYVAGTMEGQAPTVAQSYAASLMQAVKYIDEIIPKGRSNHSPGMLRQRKYEPTNYELYDFNQKLEVLLDPSITLSKLKKGTLKRSQVQVLDKVYPNLLNTLRMRVIDNLQGSQDLSFSERVRIGNLLGIPSDYSVLPNSIKYLQSNFNVENGEQNTSIGGSVPRPSDFKVQSVSGGVSELMKTK